MKFQPKKTKFRYSMKRLRHIRGNASKNIKPILQNSVCLMADEGYWLKDKHLEAIRLFIVRKMSRIKITKFKLLFRVFPHRSCSKRKPEIPMGGGKSDFFCYIAEIKKGMILFELECEKKNLAISVVKSVKYIVPGKNKIFYR